MFDHFPGFSPEIRVALAAGVGSRRVFGIVEDEDVRRWRLGGDDARVLRHVTRSVYFTLVVDLDLNFDLTAHRAKASEFCKHKYSKWK